MGLPDDILQQAAHRLGLICFVIAGLWIAELLLAHFITPVPTRYPDTAIFRLFEVTGGISLAVSLCLFWYARNSRRDPRFLLNLGLGYEVLVALSVGLLGSPAPVGAGTRGWSRRHWWHGCDLGDWPPGTTEQAAVMR